MVLVIFILISCICILISSVVLSISVVLIWFLYVLYDFLYVLWRSVLSMVFSPADLVGALGRRQHDVAGARVEHDVEGLGRGPRWNLVGVVS